MKTAARLEGSYALGIVCTDTPDALYVVREASPLILGVGVGENYFASDVTALVSHTKNVMYLEDGEFAKLTPDSITVYDCAGREVKKPISRVTWSVEAAEKGGYEHFMLMGLPREPMILKTVRQAVPRVKNVRLTEGGCCWLNGIVSIKKNKEGDGVNAIMAAFTGHPSMKNVIIVDDDIDIFNDREVEWAVATRMQADRILIIPNAAGSSLDPSSHGKTTSKVGYDATIPMGADRSLYTKIKL